MNVIFISKNIPKTLIVFFVTCKICWKIVSEVHSWGIFNGPNMNITNCEYRGQGILQITFEDITVSNIEDTSGIFIGKNYQTTMTKLGFPLTFNSFIPIIYFISASLYIAEPIRSLLLNSPTILDSFYRD